MSVSPFAEHEAVPLRVRLSTGLPKPCIDENGSLVSHELCTTNRQLPGLISLLASIENGADATMPESGEHCVSMGTTRCPLFREVLVEEVAEVINLPLRRAS